MSILLEALRKSEKSQHPHEAPDIHSNESSAQATEMLQIGPLALLLTVALFISGWFVWNQYQPPAGRYYPPVTLAPDQVSTGPAPAIQTETVDQERRPASVADNAEVRQRTPVESFQQTVESSSQIKSEKTAAAPANNQLPESTRTTSPGATPAVSGTESPIASRQEEYRPQKPEPIGYWELPDAVRSNVPELKFSVLVYATDPADRFVLINGQRLGEGDSVQPGLVIEEIRLDGVIFSYRLYQFLIER